MTLQMRDDHEMQRTADLATEGEDDLLLRVEKMCHLRELRAGRQARIERRRVSCRFLGEPDEVVLPLLFVAAEDGFVEVRYLVAALSRAPRTADLGALAALRHLQCYAGAWLVYDGPTEDLTLAWDCLEEAQRARLKLTTLAEYERILDFTAYLDQQTRNLSPPALLVPKLVHARGFHAQEVPAAHSALDTLVSWATDARAPRLTLMLGSGGAGKSLVLHELARTLAAKTAVVPLLVSLHQRSKAVSLNMLLAGHLAEAGVGVIDIPALTYLREVGRVVLLFDDFDKLALRVGCDAAAHHLATVMEAATAGNAQVVLASRPGPFLGDAGPTALADALESLGCLHVVRLLPSWSEVVPREPSCGAPDAKQEQGR